jgi:hypothetical protein
LNISAGTNDPHVAAMPGTDAIAIRQTQGHHRYMKSVHHPGQAEEFASAASELPPEAAIASAEDLWAIKRESQARDHRLEASGIVAPEAMLLLRPEQLEGVWIEWPNVSLNDER